MDRIQRLPIWTWLKLPTMLSANCYQPGIISLKQPFFSLSLCIGIIFFFGFNKLPMVPFSPSHFSSAVCCVQCNKCTTRKTISPQPKKYLYLLNQRFYCDIFYDLECSKPKWPHWFHNWIVTLLHPSGRERGWSDRHIHRQTTHTWTYQIIEYIYIYIS